VEGRMARQHRAKEPVFQRQASPVDPLGRAGWIAKDETAQRSS
jgi:hypothetical protein